MPDSFARANGSMEVENLPSPSDRPDRGVKKVPFIPERSLAQAKAKVGAMVNAAIGDQPRKQYGPDNTISGVVSGEKVADWLARLYNNDDARLRFGREWLKGASGVRSRNVTVIEWDEEKAG